MPGPPAEAISWIDATAVTNDAGEPQLSGMAEARATGKPIVIFATTRREYRAAEMQAAATFEQNVLREAGVVAQLRECVCLRVMVDELPGALRRSLHLRLAVPMLVVLSPADGKRLIECDGATTAAQLAAGLAKIRATPGK
ncbi:MAG: hypothetical protein AB7S36_06685 [Planctomycetota bacterium]